MSNRYQKLTPRILEHVLTWGNHMSKLDSWTKSDANAYDLIQREIKRLRNEQYQRYKTVEMNPYLDPDQPYHTT